MKIFLPVSALLLISLFLLFYLFNRTLNLFPDCVYYDPQREEQTIYLLGKVTRIQEKGNWFISNLELCDDRLFSVASVRVYTPKNEAFINVGREITQEGTEGYQWNKLSTETIGSVANKNNLLAVQVEELKSKEAVLGLFNDLKDFDCESQAVCRNKLEFVQTRGLFQVNFLNNLKNQNTLPLFWDFLFGKAVVYSREFGQVESLEHFQQLTRDLLLW